jgi:hypothetical protein
LLFLQEKEVSFIRALERTRRRRCGGLGEKKKDEEEARVEGEMEML